MRGRPRRGITEAQREDIARLSRRGLGQRSIALRLGLTYRQVRSNAPAQTSKPRAWTAHELDTLREHVGERSPSRLARELGRTELAVRRKLAAMGLDPEELRIDLTLEQVSELVGRSVTYLRQQVHLRRLPARVVDGTYRVWPSELRAWVDADRSRVDWSLADTDSLWGLARGEWGISEETAKGLRRRQHRAGGK